MATSSHNFDTAPSVLAFARERRAGADRFEAELLEAAVAWAAMHSTDSIDAAATWTDATYGDTGVPVAGPGAPLVTEFSIPEFATAVGVSTDVGRAYVGEAVELRHRLPRLWKRVVTGDLQAWRARRIARQTICLTAEAAGFVDSHVSHVAHKIGPTQVDRLIEEAIVRFMPDEADRRRREAKDGRHVSIFKDQVTFEGTVHLDAEIDLADAIDLDEALSSTAAQLKALGSDDGLNARRSTALGEIARHQLTLDLASETDADPTSVEPARTPDPRRSSPPGPRQVVLYVHISEAALTGRGLARVENTRSFVSTDQVADWCGNPDTHVTVKPVIDLADHISVNAYEVPDRMTEQATLADHTCVFPWCTRPARRCDCDHIDAYDTGGPTCSCNIAPLCRSHHRLKSHSAWRYVPIERGTYLWTSPHGLQFLRNHEGTLDVTRDRRSAKPHPPGL